jgi:hypothetical protein
LFWQRAGIITYFSNFDVQEAGRKTTEHVLVHLLSKKNVPFVVNPETIKHAGQLSFSKKTRDKKVSLLKFN